MAAAAASSKTFPTSSMAKQSAAAAADMKPRIVTFSTTTAANNKRTPQHIRTPQDAALFHVEKYLQDAAPAKTTSASAATALSRPRFSTRVASSHSLPAPSSASIVHVKQFVHGNVEVLGAELRVLLNKDLQAMAISGMPVPQHSSRFASAAAATHAPPTSFTTSSADLSTQEESESELQEHKAAVARVLKRLAELQAATADAPASSAPSVRADEHVQVMKQSVNPHGSVEVWMSSTESSPVHIRGTDGCRSRKVYLPVASEDGSGFELRAGYLVEVAARVVSKSNRAPLMVYRFVVARGGNHEILQEVNETRNATPFSYRVYADDTGDLRPRDGPIADWTPHPTGQPDGLLPPFASPTLVTTAGFNKFNDPWLADDATETSGNNVDAYADLVTPDGFTAAGDLRADVTAPNTFDRTFDPVLDSQANADQIKAIITHAFYTANYLHDYWYDSGFDEVSNVAQASNYGRGGVEGDAMRVEVEDYSGLNNANMNPRSDGLSPIMQMYAFNTNPTLTLTTLGPVPAAGADFGPGTYSVSAEVIDSSTSTVCDPVADDWTGKVVMILRGGCSFQLKTFHAETAGAVGVLIVNVDNEVWTMGDDSSVDPVTIPAMMISSLTGAALSQEVANSGSPVTADLVSLRLSGALDTPTVVHEWGHYLHLRLASCGALQCGSLSEGHSDFVALHNYLRDGDDLDGVYADSTYAMHNAYFGFRRFPYSTDRTKNPTTFKNIDDSVPFEFDPSIPVRVNTHPNSEVHNSGEIWAQMMFDAYVALHKAGQSAQPPVDFATVRRRLADYYVAGLKLTPADATFVEQRDAILVAAQAINADDALVMAKAFAGRGLGACAVAPSRFSNDNVGVIESFSEDFSKVSASVSTSFTADGTVCLNDGIITSGESGTLTVSVVILPSFVDGGLPFQPMTVSLTLDPSTTTSVSVDKLNAVVPFPTAVGQPVVATFTVSVASSARAIERLVGSVRVNSPGLCSDATANFVYTFNAVEVANSSSSDAFDTATLAPTVWTKYGSSFPGFDAWPYESDPTGGFNNVFHGIDVSTAGMDSLQSPPLAVSATENFVVSFEHYYSFETDGFYFYDGGVVEVSVDNGATWQDAITFDSTVPYDVTPLVEFYDSAHTAESLNPLRGRRAFVGEIPSSPQTSRVTINFGTQLAGQTVLIRFSIGTDEAFGGLGWYIFDFTVSGITNTPFGKSVPAPCTSCSCLNGGSCPTDAFEAQCECKTPGWGGVDCGTCLCENGGVCQQDGSCQCAPNYYGPLCTVFVPEKPVDGACVLPSHCNYGFPHLSNGACTLAGGQIAGTCACLPGIGGKNCQCRPVESCSGHGVCADDGSCSCFAPWSGPSCSFIQCDTTHFGPSCSLTCASCSAAGTASCDAQSTGCVCKPGFTGATCSECDATHWGATCQNSCSSCNAAGTASCSTGIAGAGCVCKLGYGGVTCSQAVSGSAPCSSDSQCMGYGVARADNGGFFIAGRCNAGSCSCTYPFSPFSSTGAIGSNCQCRVEGSCMLSNASKPYAVYSHTDGKRVGCAAAADAACA